MGKSVIIPGSPSALFLRCDWLSHLGVRGDVLSETVRQGPQTACLY